MEVQPIILTSILPFGVKKKGGRTFFRFSLCIDLKASYNAGTEPNYKQLLQFFLEYGMSKNNIHADICANIKTNLGAGTPCFSEFKGVNEYWTKLICGSEMPSEIATIVARHEEIELGKYKANQLIGKQVGGFAIPNINPHIIREQLIFNEFELKSGRQPNVLPTIERQIATLETSIAAVNETLQGINTYSFSQNDSQSSKLFESYNDLSRNKHTDLQYSTERIQDTFSFIGSNLILQRLFGTTIDFEIEAEVIRNVPKTDGKFQMNLNPTAFSGLWPTLKVTWEHLTTEMHYVGAAGQKEVVIVSASKPWVGERHSAINYDVGAKLQSLNGLGEKFRDYRKSLEEATTESERHAINKKIIQLDSAAFTRGANIHCDSIPEDLTRLLSVSVNNSFNATNLTEEKVTKGHRFGILNTRGDKINSLGERRVKQFTDVRNANNSQFKEIKLPEEFTIQHFAVNTDTAMHALVERTAPDGRATGQLEHKLVVDTTMLTWSGENLGMPSVFSNNEDETNFDSIVTEGSVSDSIDIVTKSFMRIFKEEYLPKSVAYDGKMRDRRINGGEISVHENENKWLTLQYSHGNNCKLLLGGLYKFTIVPEYKNGFALKFNSTDAELGLYDIEEKAFLEFHFKRNEPVKPITFFLQSPLLEKYDDEGPFEQAADEVNEKYVTRERAIGGREGESLHHLVIRNYSRKDDDTVYGSTQLSVRYILPPAITFEHALWHNKIFEIHQKFGNQESYKWYRKYHFPAVKGEKKLDENGEYEIDHYEKDGTIIYKKYTDEDEFTWSSKMRDCYPDQTFKLERWERPDVNYLPDPLAAGFRLEFYLDQGHTIKADEYEVFQQAEYYFSGTYPYIKSWKLIAFESDTPTVYQDDQDIYIGLRKGEQLYIQARTILNLNYEQTLETFGNYNNFTRYGNNDLLTPPLSFSITHAIQRPLIRPRIIDVFHADKDLSNSILALRFRIHTEQLLHHLAIDGTPKYNPETIPTGPVEMYSKWEEYVDNPAHIVNDNWTPNQPVRSIDINSFDGDDESQPAVFEVSIPISEQRASMENSLTIINNSTNPYANLSVELHAKWDIKETKHLEKWFWVKNTSLFPSYYSPLEADDETTNTELRRGKFARISHKPFFVRILNSKKPNPPKIASRNMLLLSVKDDIIRSGDIVDRKSSMNRIRIYFERGRLSSGKGERIGILINESSSAYNDQFAKSGFISKCGRDFVNDSALPFDGLYRSEEVLLNKSHLDVFDPPHIEGEDGKMTNDLESFEPLYVSNIGLMTYMPKFDKKLNLWYLDVALELKDKSGNELHNPFIQFGLVHFQEHSFNYNNPTTLQDPSKDCRISDIILSGFIYVLPTRLFHIDYVPMDHINISIGLDTASLCSGNRSRFYATIEFSNDEVRWFQNSEGSKKYIKDPYEEKNLNIQLSWTTNNRFLKRRILIIEFETYSTIEYPDKPIPELINIYENRNNRIISVNTFAF